MALPCAERLLLELDVIFLHELLPTDDLEPTHHTPEAQVVPSQQAAPWTGGIIDLPSLRV